MLKLILRLIFISGADGTGTRAVWGTVAVILTEIENNTLNNAKEEKKRIFWLKSEQTKISYSLAYVCGRNRFVFCAETCWDEKHYRWLIKHKSSSSPPSSWGPLSSVQASNRNQLQNSFWGIGGTRSSAAALWRWWRCGRSAGRPHPCDEWTGSQCGLHKERAFIKILACCTWTK